jgi:lipopolysaccharide export LptBFGC system permease protein LptF
MRIDTFFATIFACLLGWLFISIILDIVRDYSKKK